jgi:DGQHR domain-containing protein
MSDGRNFTVSIERKGAESLRKQIDVFGKDDETVIVAECKASDKMTKRSLQKDLEEFANLKGPIANAIHRHYGNTFKPKIIWIFITENIIWSKPDRERAAGERIQIITERELRYYNQIAEHLGKSARYQFLAEFLKDQQIPELSGKTVPAIRGKLGGKKFYCFITTPRQLLKISFVNHRSLNDPEGAPTYQRLISRARLRDISIFLKNGGYFPNSILVNFTRPVRFDKTNHDDSSGVSFGTLYLPDKYRSAWIIDGQHRLYGFSPLEAPLLDQNILILAFEQLPVQEEANLFVTINHEQKPVPKHLLDDLEGELKWGSNIPSERIGSISARLINLLNSDVGEPFHYRVTQQGITSTNKACLTIPAIKDALRRSFLLGRALMNNTNYDLGPLCGKNDSETLERARCALNQYFGHIRNANLSQWEKGRAGFLCTNVAIQAYILLLGSLIKYWEANTASDSRETSVEDILLEIDEYLSPITEFLEHADDSKMKTAFQVPFGSGGPPEYYYRLCSYIKTKYSDFEPEGMQDWESEQSEEKIQTADKKLRDLVSEINKCIFTKFRVLYGEEKNAYFFKGVPDKDIKAKAIQRTMEEDVDDPLPFETYLDVLEYKKIVDHKQNWPFFKSVFNIPEPGIKGHAKNLRWMERINELRRIPAHPSEKRPYKAEDFDYIDFIYDEFMRRAKEDERDPVLEPTEQREGTDG